MDIRRRIRDERSLTPTEQQIASVILSMGERLQEVSIKEFAHAASVSIASIHRFCKKIGLEGFKELKVEIARAAAVRAGHISDVDINFPFGPGEQPGRIVPQMRSLYATTVRDTCEVLGTAELVRAAPAHRGRTAYRHLHAVAQPAPRADVLRPAALHRA